MNYSWTKEDTSQKVSGKSNFLFCFSKGSNIFIEKHIIKKLRPAIYLIPEDVIVYSYKIYHGQKVKATFHNVFKEHISF